MKYNITFCYDTCYHHNSLRHHQYILYVCLYILLNIGNINAEKANLLADMTGWSVLQNEDEFRRMLS